jgi:hypothetical protein
MVMAHGRKTGGRQAGTPNKITATFKDAVRIVYEDIGGNAAFAAWARENPGDFYRIASRLIPTEIANTTSAFGANGVTINIGVVDVHRVIDQPQALNCIEC